MSEYAEKMQHHIVNMQNMQVIWKNTFSWSAKKYPWSIKIDRICRKNAISSSADPRTPRLLSMYMYIYVIYTVHTCVYNAVFYIQGRFHMHSNLTSSDCLFTFYEGLFKMHSNLASSVTNIFTGKFDQHLIKQFLTYFSTFTIIVRAGR